MLFEALKWFADNWLTLFSVALTALGTILTFIGYQRTRRASEALKIIHAYRNAFRLYESALKAYWNSHKYGRKLALSAIDDLLAECERYRERFEDEGLQPHQWEELTKWANRARDCLVRGEAGDYYEAQENLSHCVTILKGLIGNLENKLDQLIGREIMMGKIVQLLKELLERTEQGKLKWEKISRIDYETVIKERVRFTLSLTPTTSRFTGRVRFTPDKYLPYLRTFKVESLTPVLYIVDVREDRVIARVGGDDPNLDRECVELLEDLYELVEKHAQEPDLEADLESALQVLRET